jgi:hypothetical protein
VSPENPLKFEYDHDNDDDEEAKPKEDVPKQSNDKYNNQNEALNAQKSFSEMPQGNKSEKRQG